MVGYDEKAAGPDSLPKRPTLNPTKSWKLVKKKLSTTMSVAAQGKTRRNTMTKVDLHKLRHQKNNAEAHGQGVGFPKARFTFTGTHCITHC